MENDNKGASGKKKSSKPAFLIRGTFAYRLFWISAAFALLGAAIFVPLGVGENVNYTVLYTFLGLYIASYVLTVLINEWVIYRKSHLGK